MMQLWDRKQARPVYSSCIHPLEPYKRKKSHLKVRCVTKRDEDSYSLLIACVVSWLIVGVLFVRWWLCV